MGEIDEQQPAGRIFLAAVHKQESSEGVKVELAAWGGVGFTQRGASAPPGQPATGRLTKCGAELLQRSSSRYSTLRRAPSVA